MSKKFDRYKVNCSDVADLMSREHGIYPPTEKQLDEFLRILQKDMVDITIPMKEKLQKFVLKTVNYSNHLTSLTFKKVMYEHYAYSQYGASRVSKTSKVPMQLEKGEVAEPNAIGLLSKIDGIEYIKNEKLLSNKFFKGIPDIILSENDKILGVKDVKTSFDLPSFLERVDGDSVTDDRWEMLAYLDILDLKEGEIVYCLVDMPEKMKELRLREHEERMISIGISKDHIKRRLKQIENSMVYDYVPDELRVKRFTVERKRHFTKQMHDRVKRVRQELYRLDLKFHQKNIILSEIEEALPPEDTF